MNRLEYIKRQSQFHANFYSVLAQLVKVRNDLIVSLISQLNYNKILLNNLSSSPITEFKTNTSLNKIQPNLKEEQNYCNKVRRLILRKNRKIKKCKTVCLKTKANSLRNDTKNIPKNYGKAILTFISKSAATKKVIKILGLNLSQFLVHITQLKNKINSIESLKKMWGSDELEDKKSKCIRILSYYFMRRHCLRYIFCSKVRIFSTHIKYRQKLIEGIQKPTEFSHIKEY